jgi:hypothetical protein
MARGSNTDVIGLIAIIVGGLLVMGGLMFLLTTSFMNFLPRVILIPPVVQIVLGLLCSVAGFFLRRGHATAKFVLLFIAIGLVANGVFLASILLETIR